MPPIQVRSKSAKPFDTRDIPYLKLMITTLSILGFWSDSVAGKKRWYSSNPKYKFVGYLGLASVMISYIRKNVKKISFLDMGPNYINMLLLNVCLARMLTATTKIYKKMSNTFFDTIHLYHYKDRNDFSMKTFIEVEKYCSFFVYFLHVESFLGALLYSLTPILKNWRSGMFNKIKPANVTYEHAVYYDLPFDYQNNFRGFLIVYLANFVISFDISHIAGIVDSYLYMIVFQLWGHLKILKYNLRHFPRPQMTGSSSMSAQLPWYNEEESRVIRNMLIESIEHYKIIKDFMKDLSTTFGAAVCFYFMYFQICGCILLVETFQMTAEAIGTHGVLTVSTFQQLIQISTIFELVGSQSDTLVDAVYEVPWECMDVKNRKIVLFYIKIAQRPLNFKPLGMMSVGVQTMASILKTTFSYFMLLRTTTSAKN